MKLTAKAFASIFFSATASQLLAAPNHLGAPSIYDNAGPGTPWGQTFIAEDSNFLGITWYIGDPTRPGNPTVDGLTGDADLVLYDVTSPLSLIELARRQVQTGNITTSGLSTYSFLASVPTTPGTKYFAAIETNDAFGVGLRALSSTYAGGSEAYILSTGFEEINGRDTSFAVISIPEISIPEPSTNVMFGGGLALLAFLARRTARTLRREVG